VKEDPVRAARGPFAGTPAHRDAPYWQSPPQVVERMLELAKVGPGDCLIDLGCGDGRIAIAAAWRGARAIGVDIDAERIAEATAAAVAAGVDASFRQEDLFDAALAEASVVSLYLLGHVNNLLRDKLLAELRPGARVVSHAYSIAGWEPSAREELAHRAIYLWTV
jgi:cyclopropane fatty-acyl-phospholipid synthase-like methyltransferase